VASGGRSLAPAYRGLVLWIGAVIVGLAAITAVVVLVARR
jgi:hypothetical protein